MSNDPDAGKHASLAGQLAAINESVRSKVESARLMDELLNLLLRITQMDPGLQDRIAEKETLVKMWRAAVLSAVDDVQRAEREATS